MPVILAIDTSTEACSVAIQSNRDVDSLFEVCPQQHSQKVLPMVQALLNKHQLSINAIDAIAFGCGPGSFTGVRIATSTVQGLAYAADKPLIAISTLAAMAYQNFEEFNIETTHALIDARMQEVYSGKFTCKLGQVITHGQETVSAPAQLADEISKLSSDQMVGTGYHAYANELGVKTLPKSLNILYPSAKHTLALAINDLQEGKLISPAEVKPTYLRDKVTWKKLPGKS